MKAGGTQNTLNIRVESVNTVACRLVYRFIRKMNVLLWSSLLWVLYQCGTKVDWIAVQVQWFILWLPEVNREFLLNSARTLTRVFCFLYIIWHVFRYYRARMQYKMLLSKVTYFMTFYKIPKHIQDRVLQCYQQAWNNNQIPISDREILPNELCRELFEHVGNTVLDKLQLNQECFRFIISIAPKIKIQYYSPGQFVCRKGSWADKMFFVADGILEVTTDSGVYLDTMSLGDVVGEIGVLNIGGNYLRTANVRSVGDSELFALKEQDVNEIIKDFPEAKKMLKSLGKKRLLRSKSIPEPHFDD